jgi:hypothetical protein
MIEEPREETARGRQELPETPHERANDRKDRRGEALQAPRVPIEKRARISCVRLAPPVLQTCAKLRSMHSERRR